IATLPGHPTRVTSVTFAPAGDRVVTGAGSTARVWDVASGKQVAWTPNLHTNSVLAVAVSPDDRLLATGSRALSLRLWHLDTAQLIAELKGHEGAVTSIDFSPDSRRILAGTSDGKLDIWDVGGQTLIASTRMHAETITGLALSGGRVATASS